MLEISVELLIGDMLVQSCSKWLGSITDFDMLDKEFK